MNTVYSVIDLDRRLCQVINITRTQQCTKSGILTLSLLCKAALHLARGASHGTMKRPPKQGYTSVPTQRTSFSTTGSAAVRVYKYRWVILALFALLSSNNGMLYIIPSTITTVYTQYCTLLCYRSPCRRLHVS